MSRDASLRGRGALACVQAHEIAKILALNRVVRNRENESTPDGRGPKAPSLLAQRTMDGPVHAPGARDGATAPEPPRKPSARERARDRTTTSVRTLIVVTLLALVALLSVIWNAG